MDYAFIIYFNFSPNRSLLFLLKINLKENTVNLFLVRLSKLNDEFLNFFKNTLTNDELLHFDSYKSDKNKTIGIVSRGLFRSQFSRILNIPFSDIKYVKTNNGKPKLFTESKKDCDKLDFNLSHVEDWVILAISPFQIGIDIEYTLRKNNLSKISNRFFSKVEIKKLNHLNSKERIDLFFTYWTLKEAYLKAKGLRIADGLKDFFFVFDDGGSIEMFSSKTSEIINSNWSFASFSPEEFYKISLAYQFKECLNFNFYEMDSPSSYVKLDWSIRNF